MSFCKPVLFSPSPAHLQQLQVTLLLVAVQYDVIGHAEALSDTQVIEERGLAERIIHLYYGNIYSNRERAESMDYMVSLVE